MQLKTFLSALHECDKSTFEAVKPYNYKGVFNGKQQTILAHAAPSFLQKKGIFTLDESSIRAIKVV